MSAPHLPAKSAIPKWLGTWANACDVAGLQPPPARCRAVGERRRVRATMLAAIRRAWATDGELTSRRYAAGLARLGGPEGSQHARAPTAVVAASGSWSKAVTAAGTLAGETFHPEAVDPAADATWIWTVGDVRRLLRA